MLCYSDLHAHLVCNTIFQPLYPPVFFRGLFYTRCCLDQHAYLSYIMYNILFNVTPQPSSEVFFHILGNFFQNFKLTHLFIPQEQSILILLSILKGDNSYQIIFIRLLHFITKYAWLSELKYCLKHIWFLESYEFNLLV